MRLALRDSIPPWNTETTSQLSVHSLPTNYHDIFLRKGKINVVVSFLCVCLLITLTRTPKAELLKGTAQRDRPNAHESQTFMNDPGGQQPSQMFLTWELRTPYE